jgi:hypothetical protein
MLFYWLLIIRSNENIRTNDKRNLFFAFRDLIEDLMWKTFPLHTGRTIRCKFAVMPLLTVLFHKLLL